MLLIFLQLKQVQYEVDVLFNQRSEMEVSFSISHLFSLSFLLAEVLFLFKIRSSLIHCLIAFVILFVIAYIFFNPKEFEYINDMLVCLWCCLDQILFHEMQTIDKLFLELFSFLYQFLYGGG